MASSFKVKNDRYNSITLTATDQPFDNDNDFIDKLKVAIDVWRDNKVRGVWIKVHLDRSSLVPRLVELGFDFHHAQPGYVMLSVWLPQDETNNLPSYANQYIGVGGFVINSKQQVLVIQERFQSKPHWKLPGGLADKGEDLWHTAEREVFEETGVKCKFEHLLSLRHQHNYKYGCSDIYFVCVMKAITEDITQCPKEITLCQWMDIEDYVNQKDITVANRHIAQVYMDSLTQQGLAIIPSQVQSFTGKVFNAMYSVQRKDKKQIPIE